MRRAIIAILLSLVPMTEAQQALTDATAPALSSLKPRVLLRAPTRSGGWTSMGSRSLDISKDFMETCPDVHISINLYVTDYTVEVNTTQHGYIPEHQMLI